MRIATWNVNSIRQRIEPVMAWLKETQPDIACLQEIKCTDDAFPRLEFESLGYSVVTHGQKTFNGVALLSKLPFDETKSGLAGDDEDAHARFLEGVVTLKSGVLRIACLYLPNGNPADSGKYPYKLKWMSRLLEYSKERLKTEEPLILAGDFNVIPAAEDVHNPAAWVNDALFRTTTRESFQALLGLGLTDALRAVNDAPGQYTFWDYQAGAWQKNWGLRIDHLLMSPQASDRLIDVGIDSYVRAWEKPSDHVPVWADLDLDAA
ncbi:MAG TPA: exodeoxyribonuclease III [Bradyrhizobium sp.]